MGFTSILKLTSENPNYPGPGEFSTVTEDHTFNYDPKYNKFEMVQFTMNNGSTRNFEIRSKKKTTNLQTDQTTVTYNLCSIGSN